MNRVDYAHEFVSHLCDSIEAFVKRNNESGFFYRGLNLYHAVEIALYSSLSENKNLFSIFEKWNNGSLKNPEPVENAIEKKIASILCSLEENKFEVIRKENAIKRVIKLFIRFALRFLGIRAFVYLVRKILNKRLQKGISADVLFYVPNDRFVKYAKPIFDSIKAKVFYISHEKKAVDYCKKENIPCVNLSYFGSRILHLSNKKNLLDKFFITDKVDLVFDSIKRLHPKSIVVVEGNGAHDEIANQIAKSLNIKSVCVQQGWSPIVHNGFRNMSYSKMLVWGEGFAELLQPYNPKQKFIVTGSHILELNKEEKNIEKVKSIAFFAQGISRILNEKAWRDHVKLAVWTAKTYPDTKVIFREHPLYKILEEDRKKIEQYENVVFMNSDKYKLDEVMAASQVSVSIYSSTILESVAAGVLPIIFNVTSFPNFFPDIAKEGAGIEVKSFEAAQETISKLLNNPEIINGFRKPMMDFQNKYFAFNKETALQNIIKEIMQ